MRPDPTPFLASLLLTVLATACQQPAAELPAPEQPTAPTARSALADEPQQDLTYEPAYPADVSSEGLDADDTAQQTTHSHGGEGHSHGEDSHTHDEGGQGGGHGP